MNILSGAQFYCRYPRSSLLCQVGFYLWPCLGIERTDISGQAFPMNRFGFNALSLLQAQVLPYLCHLPVSSLFLRPTVYFCPFFFFFGHIPSRISVCSYARLWDTGENSVNSPGPSPPPPCLSLIRYPGQIALSLKKKKYHLRQGIAYNTVSIGM